MFNIEPFEFDAARNPLFYTEADELVGGQKRVNLYRFNEENPRAIELVSLLETTCDVFLEIQIGSTELEYIRFILPRFPRGSLDRIELW